MAAPAVALAARRAQRGFAETRAPLLGVMGAFVFAAQMINFPVGVGVSGHLVGGALLAITLGPAAAMVAMTAILTLQALIFQDGGVLALGANVVNMAMAGVVAGYVPYHLLAGGKWRKLGAFAGGFLSVLVSALLAMSELLLSGVRMPGAVIAISVALFAVSAALEGAITVASLQALAALNPQYVDRPPERARALLAGVAISAVLLAAVGVLFASQSPDGLEKLAEQVGIASRATAWVPGVFADYEVNFIVWPWLRKAVAGLAGLAMIYLLCWLAGRWLGRRRK